MKCPICGNDTLDAKDYLYEVPEEGKVVLSNWECSSCGYKFRDVKPYESSEPKRLELLVEDENDMSSLVYRSSFAKVYIPELDFEAEPLNGAGAVTTVRGLLEIFLDQIGNLMDTQDIREAMDGKMKFTLIIEDGSGLSFIKNEKTKVTRFLSPSPP
ncbi:ZPR1 zinc finger domain-containing protein [Sulfuracidifex tepidarius]|uniref:Zinc finger ZPR1-type domain-containing protein n=1 Tax=Sulfuracidifex tepidarius TaxID=1294262 RepID=A0A510E698_9CREN|nr:ZPR1 zinc finger domain-containing protein [Sulfuracidifex tepidarius]BBG28062.1 hypothetical protein IC007_2617 [Sulfuracidifex tepidarius]